MRPSEDLLVGAAMALHQGKGEMLATVLAAHVIEHITIKHFEEVFSFVLAMRAPNTERGDFITHFGTEMCLALTVHKNATEGVAPAIAPKVTDDV